MEMEKEDISLVKKAMRENPKAFSQLIRKNQEYLYRVALQQSGEEQDALDIVQESILKAYKNIRGLREPSLFKTWITRIVINTARDTFRRKRENIPIEQAGELPAGEGLSTEEKMDLYEALERLPDKYRSLVSLKYFQDMNIKEISKATGMPEGTVSVYLSRALKELKKELNGERKENALCKKI